MKTSRRVLSLIAVVLLSGAPLIDSFSAIPTSRTAAVETAKVKQPTTNEQDSTEEEALRQYQSDVSAPLASSFEPSSFNPFPLFSNQHFQTVVATFFRQVPEISYFASFGDTIQGLLRESQTTSDENDESSFWDERQCIDTPDGDFFHVDVKRHASSPSKKGMVVMCHGLESNSHSNLSQDMAQAYYNIGLDVACLNFRGCTGPQSLTIGGYHLGFSNDLLQYLDILTKENKNTIPLYLSGFSLGANVILKALGELKMDALSKYNIQGATAFCVPYDAERNAPFLGQPGFNQVVYCGNLLKTLRKRAQVQLDLFCDGDTTTEKFDYHGVMQAKTITDFDEAFIAPIYGFDSAIDYYRKNSCYKFLPDIAVPTYILTARDDPFMDPTHLPIELTQEGGGPAPIKMVATEHGGHCGFIFHQVEKKEDVLETSWASTELARFFAHLQQQQNDVTQAE